MSTQPEIDQANETETELQPGPSRVTAIACGALALNSAANEGTDSLPPMIMGGETLKTEKVSHEKITPETRKQSSADGIKPDNSLGLYFSEVGRNPLLTPEEEADLAKRYVASQEAQKILSNSNTIQRFRPKHRDGLKAIEKMGIDAKNKLVVSNLRLVVPIAKRYTAKAQGKIPLLDLIQSGNVGLMHAVEKFDYRRGYRFSTYATWWVRQAIGKHITDAMRTIRLPVHADDKLRIVESIERDMSIGLGREPTIADLAECSKYAEEAIIEWKRASDVTSLNKPLDTADRGAGTLEDLVVDEYAIDPEDAVFDSIRNQALREAIKKLPEREQYIIKRHYGMIDGEAWTLDRIGRSLGITRERTRQIEIRALRRLNEDKSLRGLL